MNLEPLHEHYRTHLWTVNLKFDLNGQANQNVKLIPQTGGRPGRSFRITSQISIWCEFDYSTLHIGLYLFHLLMWLRFDDVNQEGEQEINYLLIMITFKSVIAVAQISSMV